MFLVPLISCDNNSGESSTVYQTKTQWANTVENRTEIAKQYDSVGENHNQYLDELYTKLTASKSNSRSSNAMLTKSQISKIIDNYCFGSSSSRSTSSSDETTTGSIDDIDISDVTKEYIEKVDLITKSDEENTLENVISSIENLETEALLVIPSEDQAAFLSYTATARASLAYWTENIESWDSLTSDSSSDSKSIWSSITSAWKKFRKRIATMAASDAAGAAMGAAVASIFVVQYPPLYPHFAKIVIWSSAYAGLCSSAISWNKNCFYASADPLDVWDYLLDKHASQMKKWLEKDDDDDDDE